VFTEAALGRPHPGTFQTSLGTGSRKLIPALLRGAFGMMRKPILIGVNANQIFERASQPDFLMRFELGQVNENVRIHRRAAEEIVMMFSMMPVVGFGHVIGSTIQPALTGVTHKLARSIQTDLSLAKGIA